MVVLYNAIKSPLKLSEEQLKIKHLFYVLNQQLRNRTIKGVLEVF